MAPHTKDGRLRPSQFIRFPRGRKRPGEVSQVVPEETREEREEAREFGHRCRVCKIGFADDYCVGCREQARRLKVEIATLEGIDHDDCFFFAMSAGLLTMDLQEEGEQ